MARKNYSLAVMIALWLLALCTCFAYVSWAALICVVLLTALFVAALWMLYFKNNMLLMHITVALTAVSILVLFIIMLDIFGSNILGSAIAAMLLGIFYLLAQFLLKTEHVNRNNKFYLYGVILFAVLYVLLDDFIVGGSSGAIGYTSAAAVLVAALYSLLFYKIKLRPFAAYIAIGLYAVLTIILWVSYYRYYVGYGIPLMELLIQLVLLGGYILFDVLRKKVPAKSAEAAPGQTEPSLDEKLAQLEELQTLREAGVLTEEEFQTQKQKILGGNKHV